MSKYPDYLLSHLCATVFLTNCIKIILDLFCYLCLHMKPFWIYQNPVFKVTEAYTARLHSYIQVSSHHFSPSLYHFSVELYDLKAVPLREYLFSHLEERSKRLKLWGHHQIQQLKLDQHDTGLPTQLLFRRSRFQPDFIQDKIIAYSLTDSSALHTDLLS